MFASFLAITLQRPHSLDCLNPHPYHQSRLCNDRSNRYPHLPAIAHLSAPGSRTSRNPSSAPPATLSAIVAQLSPLPSAHRPDIRYPTSTSQPPPQPYALRTSSAFHHRVLTFFYPSHSHFYITIFSRSCFFFISFMIFSSFLLSLLSETSISQPSFVCLLWVCSFLFV